MRRYIFAAMALMMTVAGAEDALRPALEQTYGLWRASMIRKDYPTWQKSTATFRRTEVQNRILSEKRPFPAAVFETPAAPPSIKDLKFLEAVQKGPTAKASYFGKIDFAVGGKPTDNLLVLSFVSEGGRWLYDRADFVNLEVLPEVRKELAAGNLKYLKETPEAQPSGRVPPIARTVNRAKYIAKVYVFCPGREVKVDVNHVSNHRFANAKEAEVVIGGALDGTNTVRYSLSKLPGAKGGEAMTIRVYLMSEVNGVKPLKAAEYQVNPGETPKSSGTMTFQVDAATAAKLLGR